MPPYKGTHTQQADTPVAPAFGRGRWPPLS